MRRGYRRSAPGANLSTGGAGSGVVKPAKRGRRGGVRTLESVARAADRTPVIDDPITERADTRLVGVASVSA